ncbi:hypothetical protein ACJ41O_012802 [Fusarium nematophilum]
MTATATTLQHSGHAHVPNTCQYHAKTKRGDYIVQVAWPLRWDEDRVPPKDDPEASIIYLVDGNAYFFTAVDVSRRLEYTNNTRTIIVGIGYPPGKYVYDFRRGPDLTPATADGVYDMPLGSNGKPRTDISFGEAGPFLDFIEKDVMTHVQRELFPKVPFKSTRSALFGHSYGGIFTLNVMFTRPTLFDTFIAASPITWWNNHFLVTEQETAFRALKEPVQPAPSLIVTWGTCSHHLERKPGESDESFKKRQGCAEDEQMRDSGNALVERLEKCPSVRGIWAREFEGEDHGSAAVAGLQQGLQQFIVHKH